MKTVILAIVVLAAVTSAPVLADSTEKPLAGVWALSTEQISLRLALSQEGRTIAGTLDYPHGAPFQLKGTFDDGRLTFSGDSSGEGFVIHIDATGSLNPDGSLAGSITARITDLDDAGKPKRTFDQDMTWSAVRTPQQ